MKRFIIPYNHKLTEYAKQLRNNSTRSEIILWKQIKNKQMMGYDFHRQKPVDNYILDFFCHELMLGIELDGVTHLDEDVVIKDVKKEARLNELGITILRFNDYEVWNDVVNVLRAIEGYLIAYEKAHLTPSPPRRGRGG